MFYLLFSFIKGDTFCGTRHTSESGLISSPNYPSDYDPFSVCVYLVRIRDAQNIEIKITNFRLEENKDFLEIGSGGWPAYGQNRVDQLSGTNKSLPVTFTIPDLQAWLIFNSDRNNEDSGFLIEYRAGNIPVAPR